MPTDAPVSLCNQFACANVCVFISESVEAASRGMSRSGPNAFDRLMASSREIVLPPALTPGGNDSYLHSDQRLYNDLLGILSLSLLLISSLSFKYEVWPGKPLACPRSKCGVAQACRFFISTV